MNAAEQTRTDPTSGKPRHPHRWVSVSVKLLAAVAVVPLLIGALDSFTTVWYYAGIRTCNGELQIIDADSGEPVAHASVRVLGRRRASFESDDSGLVVLPVPYETGRTATLFRERKSFVVEDLEIEVAKESYRTAEELISFQREKEQQDGEVRVGRMTIRLHPVGIRAAGSAG